MATSPNVLLGYLFHDRASAALEQLDVFRIAALPHATPADQRRELDRLQREAAGDLPITAAEEAAERRGFHDREWARLRRRLPSAGPGLGRRVSAQLG